MTPSICGARHPITRDHCIRPEGHEGRHVASVTANSLTWHAVPARRKTDTRERIRNRDARQWGWTEGQR